ncbi:hypothetical protein [Microbacterium aerolatum]|uniref:hypothetical protein n=1 Tax=Microbacterium aerolatum TaxID=153731 RepID=UPI00384A7FEE
MTHERTAPKNVILTDAELEERVKERMALRQDKRPAAPKVTMSYRAVEALVGIDRDRALAEHDRQVAERAWDEGYWLGINGHTGPGNPYKIPSEREQS